MGFQQGGVLVLVQLNTAETEATGERKSMSGQKSKSYISGRYEGMRNVVRRTASKGQKTHWQGQITSHKCLSVSNAGFQPRLFPAEKITTRQHQAPPEADVPQAGAQAPQQPFPANNIPDLQLLSHLAPDKGAIWTETGSSPNRELLKWPDVASLLKRTGIEWDSGRT